MKKITTISVGQKTRERFQKLADERGVSMIKFMEQVAEFLVKSGQDVAAPISPEQAIAKATEEVTKAKDTFISFQRTFEKKQLQPLVYEIKNYQTEFVDYEKRMEMLEAEVKGMMLYLKNELLSFETYKLIEERSILTKTIEALKKLVIGYYFRILEITNETFKILHSTPKPISDKLIENCAINLARIPTFFNQRFEDLDVEAYEQTKKSFQQEKQK